jgi:hypothetical protein
MVPESSDSGKEMKRISLKGVAIGSITDILSTNLVLFPVLIYVLASAGVNANATTAPITTVLKESTFWFISSPILGGLCSMLGGYVAARISKHDELLNGGLSSILCVGSGVYALVSGSAAGHLWLHLVYLPLSVALGTFGGLLRARQNPQRGLNAPGG